MLSCHGYKEHGSGLTYLRPSLNGMRCDRYWSRKISESNRLQTQAEKYVRKSHTRLVDEEPTLWNGVAGVFSDILRQIALTKKYNGKEARKMGKSKSRKYKKTLHQQAYSHLQKMMALGESKEEAKKEGKQAIKYIHLRHTRSIWNILIILFDGSEKHIRKSQVWKQPDDMSTNGCRPVDKELSAWTVQAEAAALNKYYGIGHGMIQRVSMSKRENGGY